VERLTFGIDAAFTPRGEEQMLQGVTVAPLSLPISLGSPFQAAVFRIEPGGRIARHPATYPQLLAVLDGAGEVSGEDGAFAAITAGEAVFWEQGEEHETRSEPGLTALILEGEGLRPFRRPP
jgi:quercetin dioxygenase-like cupin family protein